MSEPKLLAEEFPLDKVPEILCIGVNPAFQTTLLFQNFKPGCVNRAFLKTDSIGGKGQNVAISIQQIGRAEQVAVLQFTGGETGKYIQSSLEKKKIQQYNVMVKQPTRTCTIVLDVKTNTTTDLIEPSSCIQELEYDAFKYLAKHLLTSPNLQALAICGTLPQGIDPSFYTYLVKHKPCQCSLLLDAYVHVEEALMSGNVDILKINHEEAVKLAQIDSSITHIGKAIIEKFKLRYLVITDGPQSAILFILGGPDTSYSLRIWEFLLPSWTQLYPLLTTTKLNLDNSTYSKTVSMCSSTNTPILHCVGAGDTCM
ncbi:hypothetical protein HMI55_001993 [Coelomomyces lativittatus]|nr:hypothetical protein HMI55_001993 [Coelomomyces lativittatus]